MDLSKTAVRGKLVDVDQSKDTLFPGHDVVQIVDDLNSDSWYPDFNLDADLVVSIRTVARSATAKAWVGHDQVEFKIERRQELEKQYGRPIVLAKIDCAEFELIQRIGADPLVYQIAGRFLGYAPKHFLPKLYWSFATVASKQDRLDAKQAIRFHHDLHASRFLCFNFYLTDVDDRSGPHVLVRGSHGPKPIGVLFKRTGRSDEYIEKRYGADKIETICGHAGYGFVENNFCYHKATAPIANDRLMLMLHVS